MILYRAEVSMEFLHSTHPCFAGFVTREGVELWNSIYFLVIVTKRTQHFRSHYSLLFYCKVSKVYWVLMDPF